MGQSSSNAADILDMLAGKISETELGQDLLGDIEKIPGLQDQIDALDESYDPTKTYIKNAIVRSGQLLYQAKGPVPINTPPPNATYWLNVGQSVETANGLAQQVATNTTDIDELDGAVTATATAFQALRASYRDAGDGNGAKVDALKAWASTAAIATESKVRASDTEATAQLLTTYDAKIGQNAANITELTQVVATNQSAMATKTDQLSVSVGQNTAAVQQTTSALADTNDKLSTLWSVKMETTAGGQKYAASFGLGLQVDPSGVSSQFVVRADTFMLLNLIDGVPRSPFAVSNGQTFIREAFIQDGTITNAKIGDYICSTNYQMGQTGWAIFKNGGFEMNGQGAGQARIAINNSSVKLYHPNGNLAINLSV